MSLQTIPYKGARDFYPNDFRIRQYIFDKWVQTCLSYGYEQYDSSVIEPTELYKAKTSQEIVSEQTYEFTDRGDRQVTLRPEMTPSVSRMVAAKRQELSFPLRWFSIPNVWRYERPQRGRMREHWQLNVDLFGINNITGDFEVIDVADKIMQAFGANRDSYIIKINSRQIINYLLGDVIGLAADDISQVVRLIDRKNKMPEDAFKNALHELVSINSEQLVDILNIKSFNDLPDSVKSTDSFRNLTELFNLLGKNNINNAKFDISLMRGFDYYTDLVFEVFDTNTENNRSLFGGGRYDGLVGLFGVEPVPTVGFGMGDVTMRDFLETHNLMPELSTSIDATIIPLDINYIDILPVVSEIRNLGINVSVDSSDRKIDKKLKSIAKNNVKYALIIGQDELINKKVTIKNLINGEQAQINHEQIKTVIKS